MSLASPTGTACMCTVFFANIHTVTYGGCICLWPALQARRVCVQCSSQISIRSRTVVVYVSGQPYRHGVYVYSVLRKYPYGHVRWLYMSLASPTDTMCVYTVSLQISIQSRTVVVYVSGQPYRHGVYVYSVLRKFPYAHVCQLCAAFVGPIHPAYFK